MQGILVHVQFKKDIEAYDQEVIGLMALSIHRRYPTGKEKNGVYLELTPGGDQRQMLNLLEAGLRGLEQTIIELVDGKLYRIVSNDEIIKVCGRSWSEMYPEEQQTSS